MIETLQVRIRALSPIIKDIIKVSGAPGASIGVVHQGEDIHTEGFGFRDVVNEFAPDEDTIYYLASLSKSFTATMVAMLVDRGEMKWDTPVSRILPSFRHWDESVQNNSNVIDFLAHRSGLAPKNNVWNIEFGQTTMDRHNAMPMVSSLEKLFDLRAGFKYNNWGYAVADEIITTLSPGLSWGTALKTNIFEPLGMSRTITSSESGLDNRAEHYQALSNGKPHLLEPRPQFEDGKIMQGAIGVQSCVRDLLTYYKALLSGLKDQTHRNTTSSPNNPLVQVPTMLQAHSKMFELPSGNENSYALGWARTELPATLGSIGLNPTYISMPLVGKGLKEPKLCLWHQGSNMCSLHFVALLPDTNTAVVVLSNGLANNDVSDWIGQLLLQTILDVPEPVDYLRLAQISAQNSNARWPKIKTDLESERTHGTVPLPLPSYVGQFYNKIKTFYIEVQHENGQLQLCFQGNHQFWYAMEHYEHDIFTWVLTRDDNAKLGRLPVTWRNFYKMRFQRREDNSIDSLIWEHDGAWADGERFYRIEA
ncbi:beta-lactamase/transpeptidase-like protein [Nemania abortiva]|nr:beta-lactamase/transpeptidase-like protein [Nemania abortiva]